MRRMAHSQILILQNFEEERGMKLNCNKLCSIWFALICLLSLVMAGCSETVVNGSGSDGDLESETELSVDGDSDSDTDVIDNDSDEIESDEDSEGSTESETDALVCQPETLWCEGTELHSCNEDGTDEYIPEDCGPIGCEDDACVEEYALTFAGEEDAIQIASSFLIRRLTEATIEMWVWLEDREETEDFTAHNLYTEGDPSRLLLGVYTTGQIFFSEHDPDNSWVMLSTDEEIFPFERWTHVAVTKNASQRVVYLNGEQIAANNIETVPFNYPEEDVSILSRKMYGIIDEVRLSTKAQYTGNFTSEYRYLSGNSDEDIIGLWHFNNSGTDESESGNNIPTASCNFTDKAVWRNWECTPGWKRCASETTVDICNESGRWVEWETCQSNDTCVSESQTDAACVEQL